MKKRLLKLGSWLNEYLDSKSSFTPPYQSDRQGVHPEPWHPSFKQQSDLFKKPIPLKSLKKSKQSEIIFREELIKTPVKFTSVLSLIVTSDLRDE